MSWKLSFSFPEEKFPYGSNLNFAKRGSPDSSGSPANLNFSILRWLWLGKGPFSMEEF